MPFHPRRVDAARPPPLFRSLEQVSAHALVRLLAQLAELSRCAGDIFGELEGQAAALGRRTRALHRRLDALHGAAARLDHRRVKIPVSNLDEESRWTVHYTAPWHQQENVFLPSTRPPCVEDLHRQAKLNLKSVLRECDKLRRDGYRSSQYYSQGPTFAASCSPQGEDYQDEDDDTDQKSSISSSEEERLISIRRSKTPTSSDLSDLNTQTNWTKSLPLPTPEEKMRQQAQTVQADVVPINITASVAGHEDDGHSAYSPDHCATLGRLDSYRAAGPRSETRDSSCQTEEEGKVVPPSMRRIRAQRGHGIAAQMGHLSGSSGNMSVLSDSAGIVCPSRLRGDAGFHSLPRSGARASTQSLGALGPPDSPDERSHPRADDGLGHLGGVPRAGALLRPRSHDLRFLESDVVTSPACVVSPHATYTTSLIPNATLSSSSEVIVIHTAQSPGQSEGKLGGCASYIKTRPRDHALSRHGSRDAPRSPSGHWARGHPASPSQACAPRSPCTPTLLSLGDSADSLSAPAQGENGGPPGALAYPCKNKLSFPAHPAEEDGKSESSATGGRSQASAKPWECSAAANGRASPLKPPLASPGHSTPTSTVSSCSLDQASQREDARSLYSEDPDASYAAAHGSGNLCHSNNGFGEPRHSVGSIFDGRAPKSPGDGPAYLDKALSRHISLKKAKKPPLPPSRTDSLRRAPKKSAPPNGQLLNESLIASLQHSLQLNLAGKGGSSPSHSPCSDLEEPWLPRSRSQSTLSAGSSLASATTPNVYALGGLTPSQSDTSSVKSEYTDPWGYYIDYTGVQEDPGQPGHSGGGSGGGCSAGNGPGRPGHAEARAAGQGPGGSAKPKIPSPEKSHRVTSPSSGYSSQSNTPTALTPVPVFLKSMSPAHEKGKSKPKVPERKSSLISSVSISSSSTSLSSNTSTEGAGAPKKSETAPPLPGLASPSPTDKPPAHEGSPPAPSSPFPPPPPELLAPLCSPPDPCFPPPPSALSPPLLESSAPGPLPPPAPPLDPQLMKDSSGPAFRRPSRPESPREAAKRPWSKEEGGQPPMPLITTEALQMVQLRPVRKNSGSQLAPLEEPASQEKQAPVVPQPHFKPSALLRARNSINEMESESQPAALTSSELSTPARSQSQGHRDGAAERGLASYSAGDDDGGGGGGTSAAAAAAAAARAETARLHPPPGPSPSRKPPPISKKPKLFLVVPPPPRDFTAQPAGTVSRGAPSPTRAQAEDGAAAAAAGAGSDETRASSSVPVEGAAGTASPARVEASAPMVQPDDACTTAGQKEPGSSESSADGEEHVEHCSVLQDGGPEAPETLLAAAPSQSDAGDFLKEEGSDEVMTPSRPRTTEDLFAAIHRSKRKVLGRKDSDDDHTRNHSPSPPVTPTGAGPSLASPKQVGSIQRSVRKSSTSSDNFKALLLRKGSRADTSARMSAAEMLKSTDPRFQRSRSEPAPDAPESPSSCSPNKNRRAQEEWAKNEGLMPRSLSFSGPRYGRSRTPPSAASSRYSMRHRIQSSPMTVISEGEGEAPEPAAGTARGCSLEGLDRVERNQGSPLGAGEPGASLWAQAAQTPADGSVGGQGREPAEQARGSRWEDS
ncbi:NHS-like protein 1 isoform X3 [Sorex araneus]|uniref:NHS-like protein 1 isoform X3 n=1 Tax=Sorex araneus TaxID=42254 RepID=UPI0024340B16|nr:NHS-like protein 1 isoform X3 [Sorex araneus]